MTNQPAPDARPSTLHRRLTVALARAVDRARLAEAIAGDLGGIGVGSPSPLVRSEDLWLAADGFSRERSEERRALRSRLDVAAARSMHDCDTARHQLDHLLGSRRTLLEGADWAGQLEVELTERLGALEEVRDALDLSRAEQRTAQQDLERVLEQRNAAAEAIEDADRELAEVTGTGMDESGLRRELEAAGQAVRDAQEVHDAARARLEELQIEASGLAVRLEAAQPTDSLLVPDDTDVTAVIAVREALANLQAVMIAGEVDPRAVALAEAWADLSADLDQLGGAVRGPTEAELDAARQRVAAATATLAELDATTAASALTPDQRRAIDAAHAAVLAAEERIGRRRGAAGAQQRLDEARSAERALLDEHGFGGYLDVVLTGGRSAATDPTRTLAEREHFEARSELEALEQATEVSPELAHLQSERLRLFEQIRELLGVDPGANVHRLLRSHRPGSRQLQLPLIEALERVGVHPSGVSLETAALNFLEAHPLPDDEGGATDDQPAPDTERHNELAAVEARSAALEGELDIAQSEVDRTAEALQMAERSVGAFESELTVRAGEDVQRMQRFAAAEQLRAQIEAVAGTLRRAEEDARRTVEAADQDVASAEAAFDQAATGVSDLARRARQLAEELPIDQRPEGDPLRSLPALAERLRAHAEVVQPEIDRAEAAAAKSAAQLEDAMAAAQRAGNGDDGPMAEDLVEGLEVILAAEPSDALLVLDEPFVGVEAHIRTELLEVVRVSAAGRQLVLLTEDAEVLGWAIELPADEATAVPADVLFARMRANDELSSARRGTSTPIASNEPVDITTAPIDPDRAPTARRWAGQR